jgi:hypothetical protein
LTGKSSSEVVLMIIIKKICTVVKIYIANVLDLICLPEITDEIRHNDWHRFCSRGIFYFSSLIRRDLAATST